jgi:hypothetical protein
MSDELPGDATYCGVPNEALGEDEAAEREDSLRFMRWLESQENLPGRNRRPCPKCGQLVPYEGNKPAVVCFGAVYRFGPNLGRYGKLLWYHATPRFMAEIEGEEKDPRALKSLDIRVVNGVRSWATNRFPALVRKDSNARIIP